MFDKKIRYNSAICPPIFSSNVCSCETSSFGFLAENRMRGMCKARSYANFSVVLMGLVMHSMCFQRYYAPPLIGGGIKRCFFV